MKLFDTYRFEKNSFLFGDPPSMISKFKAKWNDVSYTFLSDARRNLFYIEIEAEIDELWEAYGRVIPFLAKYTTLDDSMIDRIDLKIQKAIYRSHNGKLSIYKEYHDMDIDISKYDGISLGISYLDARFHKSIKRFNGEL